MTNDIWKNSEGYNDQTAGKAIIAMDSRLPIQKKGEIWTISNPDFHKDPGEWLVIAPQTNGWVTCLEVKNLNYRPMTDPVYCVPLDEVRYVDTRNLWSKPSKYFIDKVQDISKIMHLVDEIILKALLIELPSDKDDFNTAMLRQKADIYERCFNMLAEGGAKNVTRR